VSKQLALSITLSVMAMTAVALLGTDSADRSGHGLLRAVPLSVEAPTVPDLVQLLPTLQ
jgi:hypothetical protein